jgi:hypothetical protein
MHEIGLRRIRTILTEEKPKYLVTRNPTWHGLWSSWGTAVTGAPNLVCTFKSCVKKINLNIIPGLLLATLFFRLFDQNFVCHTNFFNMYSMFLMLLPFIVIQSFWHPTWSASGRFRYSFLTKYFFSFFLSSWQVTCLMCSISFYLS